MGYIIKTTTGRNYIEKVSTTGDALVTSALQTYDKQVGSDGAANTVFTLNEPYAPGSNTLMVFLDGVKAEAVTSASDATEYEETDNTTVTFGAALGAAVVVEFIVAGAYVWDAIDFEALLEAELPDYASTTIEWQATDKKYAAVRSEILSPGYRQRSRFEWVSLNTFIINPGVYNLMGSTNRLVNITAPVQYMISAPPTGNSVHYVYLDDDQISAAPSGGMISISTSGSFRTSTTGPDWSDAKQGYYKNTNDRCIFALWWGGSGINEFDHNGDVYQWAEREIIDEDIALGGTFVDVETFRMPDFTNKAIGIFVHEYVDATGDLFYRPNGSSATNGTPVGRVSADSHESFVICPVICGSSDNRIEVKETANNNTLDLYQIGWYIPEGI